MVNTSVLNSLPAVGQNELATARLVNNLGKDVYTFLYNPESKSFNRRAIYKEGASALTSLPSLSYQYTTGLTLDLNNLILESYSRGKSIRPLLDSLQSLMVANPTRGKYAPSPVTFTWGANTFGQAVITKIDWTETAWVGGEPASARVNLQLMQIPSTSSSATPAQSTQAASSKEQPLTDREKAEAINKARANLRQTLKSLNASVAQLVRSGNYKLTVSNMGVVTISDSKDRVLGVVGTYSRGKFTTAGRTI
ncbi:hypothetical protein ACX27_26700 [Nostoc piscinale CENA21]|uniref:Uncharacterized protein n=1 Tax=Nostoc piscinale CENA21 TaxID=224013 RepID=A0A0M5MLU0_9NOSO|nr:hypothetical protein [Nostoc piscinale]ALF55618.1 hypothetical protein ACX27_26700 [Nostoc piscinale CENA21]